MSVPITLSPELDSAFKSAQSTNISIRYFHIRIQQERFVLVESVEGSTSFSSDFDSLQQHAKDGVASYFLFRNENKKWMLISYVPDKVPVKDKMLYSSAKAALKRNLGFSLFEEDLHYTSSNELSYSYYKNEKKPVEARSTGELLLEKAHKQEEEARAERTERKPVSGIGGYHSVVIPLSQNCKDDLLKFRDGISNFVELCIVDGKEVTSSNAKTTSVSELPQQINSSEPRFYLCMLHQNPVFVYCCPDKSPQKLRMVYSTAKPHVAEQIEQLGIVLAKKRMEIREGTEIIEDNSSTSSSLSQVQRASVSKPPSFGSSPSVNINAKKNHVTTPHPVYNLLAPQNGQPKTTKKIVLPPSGAW